MDHGAGVVDVLLTGYDAKRCARRIHNEWDPSVDKVEWEVPATLQLRFDAGADFEAAVFDELKAALGEARHVDLSDVDAPGSVGRSCHHRADRDDGAGQRRTTGVSQPVEEEPADE